MCSDLPHLIRGCCNWRWRSYENLRWALSVEISGMLQTHLMLRLVWRTTFDYYNRPTPSVRCRYRCSPSPRRSQRNYRKYFVVSPLSLMCSWSGQTLPLTPSFVRLATFSDTFLVCIIFHHVFLWNVWKLSLICYLEYWWPSQYISELKSNVTVSSSL